MRLVDFFIPFLATVRQFQQAPAGEAQCVDDALNALLGEARRQALDAGLMAAEIDAALFAVAAWADEILIGAAWPGAAQWQRRLLQKRYFNVSDAGVAFFTRLNSLSSAQRQVREVYFMCLGMGFTGRYGVDRDRQALDDVRQACLNELMQDGGALPPDAEQWLFPDGYGVHLPPPNRKAARRLGWRARWSSMSLSMLLLPLVVLLILYGVYDVFIWQMAAPILQQIKI
jgi:type VI secretion system protein ImpK